MTATLLPNGKQQFIDINGKPLVAGTVGMYTPGTLITKVTWKNSAQSVLNTNPIILDSRGQAVIYGVGTYRQIVSDEDGNLIWDQLVTSDGSASGLLSSVNSIADLRAIGSGSSLYNVIYVASYYGTYAYADSFGAGYFRWSPTSTATDDGGMVIAATGVVTGRWLRQLDGPLYPEYYGALPALNDFTSGTDYTTRLLAWTAYARTSPSTATAGHIGAYLVYSTGIDLGQASFTGQGNNYLSGAVSSSATVFKAMGGNFILFQTGGYCSNFVLDCNNQTTTNPVWGARWTATGQHVDSVSVINSAEFGFLFDQPQNSCYTNMYAQSNARAYVFLNGVQTCSFQNCNSFIQTNGVRTALSTDRSLYYLLNTSNINGYGTSNTVVTLGNNGNKHTVCIHEDYSGNATALVETSNPGAYADTAMGVNSFDTQNFSSNHSIIHTDSTNTGAMYFSNISKIGFAGADGVWPTVSGDKGGLYVDSTCGFIHSGSAAALYGISVATNVSTLFSYSSGSSLASEGTSLGGATVAYSTTTRGYTVSGGPSGGLAGLSFANPSTSFGADRTAYIAAVKPVMYIRFCIPTITGAATINVYLTTTSGTGRVLLGAIVAATPQRLAHQCDGTETGTLQFTFDTATAFTVASIDVSF